MRETVVTIGPQEHFNNEVTVTVRPVKLFEVVAFESPAWVRLKNKGLTPVLLGAGNVPLETGFPLDQGETMDLVLAPSTTLWAIRESAAGADVPVRVWAVRVWDGMPVNPVGRDFSRELADAS